MTEKKEIKSCPFCGGEAKIGKGKTVFWVYCPHCGAQTESYETEQEASEAWNSRQIEDAQEAEIKRLREALAEIKKTIENFCRLFGITAFIGSFGIKKKGIKCPKCGRRRTKKRRKRALRRCMDCGNRFFD